MPKNKISFILAALCLMAAAPSAGNNAEAYESLPWKVFFDEYGLQEEMCFATAIKTGFDIYYNADNEAGMWALNAAIAKRYGLKVDDATDERLDPRKSSEAAAKYMKDLGEFYGSAELAELAFLNGPTLLANTAIRHKIALDSASLEDVIRLEKMMPYKRPIEFTLTKNLEDAACLYIRSNCKMFILRKEIRCSSLCEKMGCDIETFKKQNPAITNHNAWICGVTVYLTTALTTEEIAETAEALYDSEATAMDADKAAKARRIKMATEERCRVIKEANAEKIYVVKPGDTLSRISKKFSISITELKRWNNMRSDMLRIGQKLKIKKP